MEDTVGKFIGGNAADFVAFPAVGDDPLEAILREPVLPVGTWIGGEKVA